MHADEANVKDLIAHARKHPEDAAELLKQEKKGKARTTALADLKTIADEHKAAEKAAAKEAKAAEEAPALPVVEPAATEAPVKLTARQKTFVGLRLGDTDTAPGVRGTPVHDLQKRLPRVAANGRFGMLTDRRVRDLQRENGLEVTGVVDEATAALV